MHVARERFEVIQRKLVHKVAGAENVRNLSGHEQPLELLRQVGLAVRDVQVADHQHEHLRRGCHGWG